MSSATVTSKGQITIPQEVRKALGLRPGDRVSFLVRDDGTAVVEPETIDLRTLKGMLKPKVRGVTIEAMAEAVRKAGTRK